MIRLSTPSLDRKVISARQEVLEAGTRILEEVARSGRLQELRDRLSHMAFDAGSGEKDASDVMKFFYRRRGMIKAINELLSAFPKVESINGLFEGVDQGTLVELERVLNEAGDQRIEDAEALVSDAELEINDEFSRGVRDRERAARVIEGRISGIASSLHLNLEEEEALRRAASAPSIPFEFDRMAIKRFIGQWRTRREGEITSRRRDIEQKLVRHMGLVNLAIDRALMLDRAMAIASAMARYSLKIPKLAGGGIAFVDARNPVLMTEHLEGRLPSLQPISYSIGRTPSIRLAKPRNTVMLTGANSGGKTTLLNTVAAVHILTLMGLPVPAREAEVTPMPIYLFRRRMTKRIGSLEHVLRSLIPILVDRRRKLVLIDELEALTEPGAAGRITASIINRAATTSSLFLLVTHLAKETLPYVRLPIRVDGIEATGLDERGELMVDRQPVFDHIGSSTPKLIVMKLSKASRDRALKAVYDDLLASLEGESGTSLQSPIAFPWM
jgi:energy-coupling factor transporter ATP-binding protein EcfA2